MEKLDISIGAQDFAEAGEELDLAPIKGAEEVYVSQSDMQDPSPGNAAVLIAFDAAPPHNENDVRRVGVYTTLNLLKTLANAASEHPDIR